MQKAQQARDKAVKQEHLSAQALSDAQHKHDLAVANENKASNDLSVCICLSTTPAKATFTNCTRLLASCRRLFPTADVSEAPSGSPPDR